MTARAAFKQADLTRAAKALADAGLHVAEARIEPNGTIRLLTGEHEVNDDWRAGSPLYGSAA